MNESRFVRWWQDNPEKAEAIKKRRRDKYAADKEFQESERRRKREAYAKQNNPTGSRLPKPKVYFYKNMVIELWSVGTIAKFLGIHKRTISGLESRGAIPTNRLVDDNGRRWWPADYAQWLKPYFALRQTGSLSAQEFSERVWNDWKTELERGLIPVLCEENNERRSSE